MKLSARARGGGAVVRGLDGVWHMAEGDEITIEAESEFPACARLSGAVLATEGTRRQAARMVTRWVVPLHTWAGRAELEVDDGETTAVAQLDVAPHPGKLGIEAFREMLEELTRVAQDLPWGLSPGTLAGERAEDSPSVAHPAVLEAELPVLFAALRQLRAEPLQRTLRSREVAPLRGARHVDARSLRWLASHPAPLLAVTAPTLWGGPEDAVFVEQRRTERTLRHPATAHIRFLVDRLVRRLQASETLLAGLGSEAHEDGQHARWLAARVRRARLAVEAERALSPLCLVEGVPASEGAAQAILDHPVYARVQRVARRLLDPGASVSPAGALRAPARRTHELYELLVLYRLVAALGRELGPEWKWTAADVVRRRALDVLPDGSAFVASHVDGRRIEVCHQLRFGAFSPEVEQHALHSISGERRPDAVIGLFEGDSLVRWLVVDAKYRASRTALHEGLADVHVYQDALRWRGLRAAGSFIAVPACQEDASVYATRSYLEAHRFGALVTSSASCFAPAFGFLWER